jgi:CRAL/TRIO domain
VPTFVWLFFKLITPFIDPNTREKLKFNENLKEYVPPEPLLELFGGDCKFDYEHEIFWPAYLSLAAERRESYFEKWKELGGIIGVSEWDLRGSEESKPGPSEERVAKQADNDDINVQ